jgi:hypothetical protein
MRPMGILAKVSGIAYSRKKKYVNLVVEFSAKT